MHYFSTGKQQGNSKPSFSPSLLVGNGLDRFTVPGLEADQRVLDTRLVVFGHVLMHIGVVLSDVALRAAVGNGPESEWRGVGVRTLELQGEERNETHVREQ